MIRLGAFVTHPIQYYSPLWRKLSKHPGLKLVVHYFSDISLRGGLDKDFNIPVAWDIPLINGYKSVFISRNGDLSKPKTLRIPNTEELLTKSKFDCVLLLGYPNAFEHQILHAARRLDIKIIMRAEFDELRKRNFIKGLLRKWYLTRLYRLVDAFGVIGENARQHLLKHGVSESKMVYSPYTVDTDLFEAQKKKFKRDKSRKELGLAKADFVVMFSGKFIPRKEPILLIKAMARLNKFKNLKLLMLGDGPMKDEALKTAEKLIPGKFIFPGFVNQSELGRYYSAADLFVLPSNHETWGLVVNEAMQFGLPVIVSDRVGCQYDLVKVESTGFVFPHGNDEILAEQITRFLFNEKLMKKMNLNVLKLIKDFNVGCSVMGIYKTVKLSLAL